MKKILTPRNAAETAMTVGPRDGVTGAGVDIATVIETRVVNKD